MKLLEEAKSSFKEKRYPALAVYCSIAVVIAVGLLFLGKLAYNLLYKYFDEIIMIGGAYVFFYFVWKERRKDKQEKLAAVQQEQAEQAAEIEHALAESNYALVRQCLYTVLGEVPGILHLAKPTTLSELDSPCRIISKTGFMLYEFVVMGDGQPLDTNMIREYLQMRFTQKLTANEFSGITQSNFIYNGMAYPLLYVESLNWTGSFLQVHIAWSCDAFCKYLEAKALAKQQNSIPPKNNPNDTDF